MSEHEPNGIDVLSDGRYHQIMSNRYLAKRGEMQTYWINSAKMNIGQSVDVSKGMCYRVDFSPNSEGTYLGAFGLQLDGIVILDGREIDATMYVSPKSRVAWFQINKRK